MCSRYYIESQYDGGDFQSGTEHRWRIRLTQGDIRPTDVAPVIGQSEHGLELVYADGISPVKRQKSGHQCKGGNRHG